MRRLILSAAITLASVLLASAAFAEKRVALVVGINAYASPNVAPLRKAVNDARALGGLLKRLGYEVIESYDPPRAEFNARKREFLARAAGAEVALLFYSGHGVELGAENYMLPANFPWDPDAPKAARQSLIADEGVALSKVLEELDGTDARRKVVILDACRENPLRDKSGGKTLGGERGLARPAVTPDGTYIVYSAGIGQTALDRFSDSDPDPNSVFMRRLLPELQVAGRSFDAAVKAARLKVREDARQRLSHAQHPAIYDQMFGDFQLAGGVAPPPPLVGAPRAVDDRWKDVEAGKSYALRVLDNDVPAQGGGLRVASVGAVPRGRAEVAADGRSVTYTAPTDGAGGEVSFVYRVREDGAGEAEGRVTLALTARALQGDGGALVGSFGLVLGVLTDETRRQLNLRDDVKGVPVIEVKNGTPAADKGMQPGDVVLEVGQEEVKFPIDVDLKIAKAQKQGRRSLLLLVGRQDDIRFVALPLKN